MRIRVFSDLHLEFVPFEPPPVPADVVVLAGDIDVRGRGLEWAQRTFAGTPVVYVAGNHEYYGEAIPHHTDKLRAAAAGSNVHFLEQGEAVIGGVRFLGATLWTDFRLLGADQEEPALAAAQLSMTDFKKICKSPKFSKLRPRDTQLMHIGARRWLTNALAAPHAGPTVVVTHHAPMLVSIAPRFRQDSLAPAYASDLSELLRAGAALWIHGHTHFAVDDRSSPTRVVSNQRGYPDEPAQGFDPIFVAEI
ncbi:MAG: metallophosphoesterase [Deltaproteobacteria bacterium]|nr:metallophosphoesterase [Deltaproteobacteria bacterium]